MRLAREPKQAKAFYATIAVAMLGGAALNFAPVNPIKALFWSSCSVLAPHCWMARDSGDGRFAS